MPALKQCKQQEHKLSSKWSNTSMRPMHDRAHTLLPRWIAACGSDFFLATRSAAKTSSASSRSKQGDHISNDDSPHKMRACKRQVIDFMSMRERRAAKLGQERQSFYTQKCIWSDCISLRSTHIVTDRSTMQHYVHIELEQRLLLGNCWTRWCIKILSKTCCFLMLLQHVHV